MTERLLSGRWAIRRHIPHVEVLEGRALLSGVQALQQGGRREVYRIELQELNGSGVTGTGTLMRTLGRGLEPRFTATLRLRLSGLESGQTHLLGQHTRFTYLNDPVFCPPP